MITQDELKQLLHYDPETGLFTWITTGTGRKRNGAAGWTQPDGYRLIEIKGRAYLTHRLAWLYVYGNFPPKQIDHINRIRHDNRIANLRLATPQQNAFNRGKQSNNTSGYVGVCWNKRQNKYHAAIIVNGKRISLKYHNCPKKAHEAYLKAKAEHHVI